jgi:two-component system, NarL family, response regulator NreC
VVQHTEPAIELALVDEQTLFREGIRALFERETDLAVVASVASLDEIDPDSTPRVVVTDLLLPHVGREHVVPRLRARLPDAAIVALTAVAELTTVQSTIASGASGYVLKTASCDELLAGVRAVACGRAYLQPAIGVAFASRSPADTLHLDEGGLTPKETEVLRLLALGHTNQEIANQLYISVRTAETHRSHIMRKLRLSTRAELVRYAIEHGRLDSSP